MQKLVIALRVRVIVHDVKVGLRIVVIHLVVPGDGICASYETTVNDRQFPIFTIVYLACSRQDERHPHCSFGIRMPGAPVAFFLHWSERLVELCQIAAVLSCENRVDRHLYRVGRGDGRYADIGFLSVFLCVRKRRANQQ